MWSKYDATNEGSDQGRYSKSRMVTNGGGEIIGELLKNFPQLASADFEFEVHVSLSATFETVFKYHILSKARSSMEEFSSQIALPDSERLKN